MIKKYKLFLESIIKDQKDDYIKFVYIEHGIEQGYLTCYYDYDSISEHIPNNVKGELYIDYVKSHVKGQEIGRKLIERAIEEAKSLGLSIVTLKLPNDMSDVSGLIKYYTNLGFVQSFTKEEEQESDGTKNSNGYHLFI